MSAGSDSVARPAVAIEHLQCRLGEQTRLNIDALRVAEGERVAVVGPNGSGKSTLLRVLGGYAPVAAGVTQVLGCDLRPAPGREDLRRLRSQIGQVMQGLHLVPRLSAVENVLIGCLGRIGGWRTWARLFPEPEIDQAHAALRAVGMLALADQRADRLSGGERQKVAIARMLLQRPRLILADEPTAALDPAAAVEVCELLARAAQGATLITVVHNPALLPLLAERVIGLQQGEVAFDLPIAQVSAAILQQLYRPHAESECGVADPRPDDTPQTTLHPLPAARLHSSGASG